MTTLQLHGVVPSHRPEAPRHSSPLQQLLLPDVHAWPGPLQVAPTQVPDVAPATIEHDVPEQQSLLAVHTPPVG